MIFVGNYTKVRYYQGTQKECRDGTMICDELPEQHPESRFYHSENRHIPKILIHAQ